MSILSPNSDHDDGWTWLNCVGWATAVQVLLIILSLFVRFLIVWNLESPALIPVFLLMFLYLPGVIVIGGDVSIPMSASAVRILFLLSVAFYSVLFGSLFYFAHRYVQFLRSNEEDRPHEPASESEPENREGQGETSTAAPEELSDAAAEESVETQAVEEIPAESEPAADLPKKRGMLWLRCVIGVTAVQPFLLLLCLVAPDSLLAAGIMTYFYLPARLLVDGFGLPAPVVLILFLLSVVFFSVFFGTVVCFGGPLVKRMLQRASAFKRRGRQGKKSSAFPNIEYEGKMKWGCCVSVLVVLQPLLFLCSFDDGVVGSLYKQYVGLPAEWLLPVSRQHYTDMNHLPVFLFLLLVVGTSYSVLFGSLFYWLYRMLYCLSNKLASRKAAGGS